MAHELGLEPGRDQGALLSRPARSVRSLFPIVTWLPRYRLADLPADVVAGLALAALLIPESMGYAGIAGVSAELGLYAALGAVLAYAITGGTSILVVGPASAVAALSASIVAEFGGELPRTELIAALTIATGVVLVAAGALRLGWIMNFISKPVLHAFVAGLSISIIIGQLDGLLGVDVDGESAISTLVDTVRSIDEWHGPTVAIGVAGVAALLLLERFAHRVPAALMVVAGGIALAVWLGVADRGVAVVGEIPSGLPDIGVPDLGATRWLELLGGATALLLVGFSEGYAAATAVAAETGEEVDADQELIGSGAANLGAGLLGGIAVGGSLSKSAASQAAGARTQVANLVGGLVVLATLLFLGPLFEDLPEPVLAAVVIVAVLGSADPRRVVRLWSVNRLDFAAAGATFVLVLVWETLPAMAAGVALSLAFLVRRASFPDVVELRADATGRFRRTSGTSVGVDSPVRVLRFEAPLVYANADRLVQACRALLAEPTTGVERVVLDAEMWSDLDSTGAEVLSHLDDELAERGIELRLARVHLRAAAQLERSGLTDRFAGRIDDRVIDAVDAPPDPVARLPVPPRNAESLGDDGDATSRRT
jgi:high affinity sulfate transporter 1